MALSLLKNLAKRKDGATGPLTGRTLKVQSYQVKVESVLGEGGFATIYRCSDITTKAAFALKHFRLSGDPYAVRDVQMEVAVMKALRNSPYVLHVRAVAFAGPPGAEEEAFVLLDLCKDNLFSYLQARSFQLDDYSVLRAFLPVCRAVQAMHSLDPPLAHRDLKAENVLLHPNDQWVLCDFGSATNAQQVYTNPRDIAIEEENIRKHTTPAYRAPEMWDLYAREFIGIKVDIWALGCLLYLLCYGRLPFDGDAKLQILNGRYNLPAARPEVLRSLIRDMLVVDANKRLGIDEVVRRLEQLAPPDLSRPLPGAAASAAAHPPSSQPVSLYPLVSVAPSQATDNSSASAPLVSHKHGRSQDWEAHDPLPAAAAAAAVAPPPASALAAGSGRGTPSTVVSPSAQSSGTFWQQQASAGEEGGWASFGSPPHDSPASTATVQQVPAPAQPQQPQQKPQPKPLYPTISPPSAAGAAATPANSSGRSKPGLTPAGASASSGVPDPSWASFDSPASTARDSQQRRRSSVSEEGPALVGLRPVGGVGASPFSSSGVGVGVASSSAAPSRNSTDHREQAAAPQPASPAVPRPGNQGRAGPAAAEALPGQMHSRTPSDGLPTSRFAPSPYRPSHLSGSSLPASPKHSRESSRTVEAFSRSSGSALSHGQDGSEPGSGIEGLSELESLQLRAAQLEEHCRVLEQLLEEKTSEVGVLREENARQAAELRQLKQQQQQQREQRASAAAEAAAPGGGLPPASSHGSVGRNSQQRIELDVSGSSGQSSSWVAFGSSGSGGLEDAPTPTIIRPNKLSGVQQPGAPALASSPAEPTPAPLQGHTTPVTPLTELLRSKLDMGGSGSGSGSSGSLDKTPLAQLASSTAGPAPATAGPHTAATLGAGSRVSSASMAAVAAVASSVEAARSHSSDRGWDRALPFEEFNPLAADSDTPKPPPLRGGSGVRSMPCSVQPSPAKAALAGGLSVGLSAVSTVAALDHTTNGNGSSSGSMAANACGSPLKSRPGSSVGGQFSPTKRGTGAGHRRQVSEPFFSDLNPLG